MSDSPKIKQLQDEIAAKQKSIQTIYAEARTESGELDLSKVKSFEGTNEEVLAHIRTSGEELDAKANELKALQDLKRIGDAANQDHDTSEGPASENGVKSFYDQVIESGVLTTKGQKVEFADADVKAVMSTTAGLAPESTRTGRIVELPGTSTSILDLIPMGTTSQAVIKYMAETTATNAAAETAEAGAKPEATLVLAEVESPVRKIAVLLPVTDEQLEDVPYINGMLRTRLPKFIRQRLALQALKGNGTAPNIKGILATAGIQTQAIGSLNIPDATFLAMQKVRAVFGMPNAVIYTPTDWADVRLMKETGGAYIWGPPSQPGPETMFGVRVVQDPNMTAETALVGDFDECELLVRKGISVDVGYNADDWSKNKQTFRAEMRAGLAVYRPAAFATVTGIGAE